MDFKQAKTNKTFTLQGKAKLCWLILAPKFGLKRFYNVFLGQCESVRRIHGSQI